MPKVIENDSLKARYVAQIRGIDELPVLQHKPDRIVTLNIAAFKERFKSGEFKDMKLCKLNTNFQQTPNSQLSIERK